MKTVSVPLVVLFIICGFLVGIIFCQLPILPERFFEIRLIEAMGLLTPFFVAAVVAAYINSAVNLRVKRREALGQLLEKGQEQIEELFANVQNYTESPDSGEARKVLRLLKSYGVVAHLIERRIEEDSDFNCSRRFVGLVHKFKKSVTDSPFNTDAAKFSPEQLSAIDLDYENICKLILEYKLAVYS